MGEERYIEIENYEREFWKLIELSFDLKLGGMATSASPFDNGPVSLNARFPTKNSLLRNTSYLYSTTNKLIHFISLPVLFSIINEGSIRLYNLHNSNDENEYSYAAQKLEDIYRLQGDSDPRLINTIKEHSFILSCTTHEGLRKPKFWQKYGDKGQGAAIEFEIINDVYDWEYFYCSRIHYNKLESFDTLKEKWKAIQEKNSHIKYKISLDQILSLHKSKDWIDEDEIRILTMLDATLQTIPYRERIYRDFKLNNSSFVIKYFKLPLCDKNGKFIEKSLENREEIFWSKVPRIRISDVHFGPNFPLQDNFQNFQIDLKHYIAEKMNCRIKSLPKNKL